MPSDYTIIFQNKKHFGDEVGHLFDSDVQFVGGTATFVFDCPGVDPSGESVLMFQSRDVDTRKNVLRINRFIIGDGTPESPSKDTWNSNVLIVRRGILKAEDNVLLVEARDDRGLMTADSDIDDFILDNMVIMYKSGA